MGNTAKKTKCKNGHEYTPENTRLNHRGWRVCIACRSYWDAEYRKKRSPDTKESTVAAQKKWREANPEAVRANALRHYDKIRAYIEAAKDKPCMDCGGSFPFYCMDFDHRDPAEKSMNVGLTRSLAKTKLEIEKCDVVCANCHRIRTWKGNTRGR